ncbi:MAG TPA: amidohydrolase family protein [Candidatus Binatia bacterium]|jgi:predicted TIM-barrel fold metal-dependent hydrolase
MANSLHIVDADAHVLESAATWSYLSGKETAFEPVAVKAPKKSGGEEEFWLLDGLLLPKSQNMGDDTPRPSRELTDVGARLRHMDALGVDIQVIYPTVFLRPFTRRAEVEAALYRSYNRFMGEVWREGKNRLRWVVLLPLLSMELALDELGHARENGACGVFMRGLEADRHLCDPYFFPLYEAAENLDLAVCVHSGSGSFAMHDYYGGETSFPRFKLLNVTAFHTLLFNGVPNMFPRLRFGFIESGAQWLPYAIRDLLRRIERQRGNPKGTAKKNFLADNRFYVTCQTDDDLEYILTYSGEDNLVIGTDYGHSDVSAEIDALKKLPQLPGVSAAAADKILDANARRLYGLL